MTGSAGVEARPVSLGPLSRRQWAALLGTAALLRSVVAFGLLGSMPLVSDAAQYSRQAETFVRDFSGSGPYYWPPGTSYLLTLPYALLGAHPWVARATMLVVSLVSIVVVVLLADRVLTDRRAAGLSGWALALYPSSVLMVAQPYSFDVTMLCLLLTAWLLLLGYRNGRWLLYAGAGLALGWASLSRPSSVSVFVALVPILVVLLRRLRQAGRRTELRTLVVGSAAFVVCAVGVLVPAIAHNAARGQGWTISTNNEGNLLLGNNPYTPNYKTSELGQHPLSELDPDAARYLRRFLRPGPDARAAMRREALRYIAAHPTRTALRTLNRTMAFWGFDYTISRDIDHEWGRGTRALVPALIFEVGGYGILACLVLVGLACARPLMRRPLAIYLLLLTLAFELPYMIAFSGGRWHFPVIGLLVPFAGAGLAWIDSTDGWWAKVRRNRSLWILLGIFLLIQVEYAYFTWRDL